jgi:tetratricopeptide (TPR) repeat protein
MSINLQDEAQATPELAAHNRPTGGRLLPLVACVCLGLLVYSNSFAGQFVFDDWMQILSNGQIRRIWPPWELIAGSTRPVAAVTFALNYAVHGLHLWGYHLVNLAIHIAAALTLYGIVRRTLCQSRLAARYARVAEGLALAVALVWMAHPLQTQSVTYIVQRMESLAGLFYLLTLYGFMRADGSPCPRRWYAVSVTCCILGVATKEIVATAPLIVLWYDRAFVASSWHEIWQRRKWLYLALAGAWGVLVTLIAVHAAAYLSAGTISVVGVTPLEYALTQPSVILHYVRLAFWPQGQCLDYSWPPVRNVWLIIPPGLVIVGLLVLTAWCALRQPAWGFVGAWFFLILAPTSSVMPIRDLAFEHRIYLPLAAVVVLVVIGGYECLERLLTRMSLEPNWRRTVEVTAVVVVLAILGYATHRRNEVYASEITMWRDVVQKAPYNPRAYNNLGFAWFLQGRYEEADREYREALRRHPGYTAAEINLGILLVRQNQLSEAARHFRRAIQLDPTNARAHLNLANSLVQQNEAPEAISHLREALRLNPAYLEEVRTHQFLSPLLPAARSATP